MGSSAWACLALILFPAVVYAPPCEVRATASPPIRIVAAADVPAGHLVTVAGNDGRIGIVVERGSTLAGALDTAPAVRVLMLDDGSVTTLAAGETVVNHGKLVVVPTPAVRVEVK